MSDMKWLKQALSQAAETSRWLKKEGPNLQAKASAEMAAKKAAAAGGTAASANNTIPADTPIQQQLSMLKGMLQMIPDSDPRKAALTAQIDQLSQWAPAQQTVQANAQTSVTTSQKKIQQQLQNYLSQLKQVNPNSPEAAALINRVVSLQQDLKTTQLPWSADPTIATLQKQLFSLNPNSNEAAQLLLKIQYLQNATQNPFAKAQQQLNASGNRTPNPALLLQTFYNLLAQQKRF